MEHICIPNVEDFKKNLKIINSALANEIISRHEAYSKQYMDSRLKWGTNCTLCWDQIQLLEKLMHESYLHAIDGLNQLFRETNLFLYAGETARKAIEEQLKVSKVEEHQK